MSSAKNKGDNFEPPASDPARDFKDMLHKGRVYETEHAETQEAGDADAYEAERADFEEKLQAAQAQAKEANDKYLRTLAEFDNFRKRMEREKTESISYANEKLVSELLPLYDSFEMTLTHLKPAKPVQPAFTDDEVTESALADNPDRKDPVLEGVELVFKQLVATLEKFGVKIVSGEGGAFDPNLQETIGVVASEDVPSGSVVTVHRKGFSLNGRLVRPALVTVAS